MFSIMMVKTFWALKFYIHQSKDGISYCVIVVFDLSIEQMCGF